MFTRSLGRMVRREPGTVTVALFRAEIISLIVVILAVMAVHGFPATLRLETVSPRSQEMELSELRARDRMRHGRLLQSLGGVINFPVKGNSNPALTGLYYTKLRLGSPPREFNVQIDTGSDALWIRCKACNGCPKSTLLQAKLHFFDPSASSTASPISCSDQRCGLAALSSDTGCSRQNNLCAYTFQYGDGTATSGYYVSDTMYFDTVIDSTLTTNSSTPIIFGCSSLQTGDWSSTGGIVDGILGFGQQSLSVVSQLASYGLSPRVFSHCLKGGNSGGGILVLGEIVDPNIVYTTIVPSQPHYNVELQSISVNGQSLSIDPSVFSVSTGQGTIIDTGTTLAYLPEAAYDPLMQAITDFTSQSARPIISKGNECYITTSRVNVDDTFPRLSFNFAGGARMVLNPQDYLRQRISIGGAAVWCMGFQRVQGQGITILGDLVLKDKIFVYDLERQRIGWTNYDCSLPVNVSAIGGNGRSEFVDAGPLDENGSPLKLQCYLFTRSLIALLHVIGCTLFLQHLLQLSPAVVYITS